MPNEQTIWDQLAQRLAAPILKIIEPTIRGWIGQGPSVEPPVEEPENPSTPEPSPDPDPSSIFDLARDSYEAKMHGGAKIITEHPKYPGQPYIDTTGSGYIRIDGAAKELKAPWEIEFDWYLDRHTHGGAVEIGKFARGPMTIFVRSHKEYSFRFGDKRRITLQNVKGGHLRSPHRENNHFVYGIDFPDKRHKLKFKYDGHYASMWINDKAVCTWTTDGTVKPEDVPIIIGQIPSNKQDFPKGVRVYLWGLKIRKL